MALVCEGHPQGTGHACAQVSQTWRLAHRAGPGHGTVDKTEAWPRVGQPGAGGQFGRLGGSQEVCGTEGLFPSVF